MLIYRDLTIVWTFPHINYSLNKGFANSCKEAINDI